MTNQEYYERARASYVQRPDDNPENIWFYSAFAALEALIDHLGYDPKTAKIMDHQIHNAVCWSRGEWRVLAATLKSHAPSIGTPPSRTYNYNAEPVLPAGRAREIFNQQYKIAYPGKRLNARHAKEAWEYKREKAEELARAEWQASRAAWKADQERRDLEYAARCQEYEHEANNIRQIQAIIEAITREEVPA